MFNTVKEAIQWIEVQIKFKPKTDLGRMKKAYEMLNIDLTGIKKIHVAGTNGKGSVCSYITHILMEASYKVGTYTSPYLVRFNERIKVQFEDISDEDLLVLINQIYDFNITFEKAYGEFLSFFELLTLMSLIHFSNQKVDVIVMEVGLGGLLDATNVLNYDVSLITSIGFDHMKQLGNTLESILYNKLGIVKPYHHLITTVDPILHEQCVVHCMNHKATFELYSQKHLRVISHNPIRFIHEHTIYELKLLGNYQHLNALISIKAIHYLFPKISTHKIQNGLKKAVWPGRLEEIASQIYIDGAHNTHAIDALKSLSETTFKGKNIYVLFSALGDKDILGMIEKVKSFAYEITLTSFPDVRYLDLSPYASSSTKFISDPFDAIKFIKKKMKEDDILLILGSLHFAGYMKSQESKIKTAIL
jgi:dihydrofolate synthase/folylpolyglutamate synthase